MDSRKNSRNFTKGVRIDLDDNKVTVDITIVVEYGSPVPDVARSIQENVKKAIETMSGLDVHAVDVHVAGVSFEREQKAVAELEEQRRKMLEKSEAPAEEPVKEEAPQEPEDDAEEEPDEELDDEPEEDADEDEEEDEAE